MQEHPEVNFSEEIIAGAVQNFALDAQSEESRADYIYGLIKRSAATEQLIKEILEKLLSHQEDDWGLYQLFDLAVLIHKDGYPEALPAIYERFTRSRQDDYELAGKQQVKEAGGVEGVLTVATLIGEILYNDEEEYEDRWAIDEFQKNNPSIDIYAVLQQEAEREPFVKAYYESIVDYSSPLR